MALNSLDDIGLKTSADETYSSIEFEFASPIDNVTKNAFCNSTRLTKISIPKAKAIEVNAFEGCESLNELELPGINYNGKDLFGDKSALNNLTKISIANGSNDIGTAFSGLLNLQQLTLPNSITVLHAGALSGTQLTSVRLADSVRLENDCLSGIDYLRSIEFPLKSAQQRLGLSTDSSLAFAKANIVEAVENLSVFKGCTSLQIAEFTGDGENIKSIAEGGFEDCTSLLEADFSGSEIAEIPENAFKGCVSLTGIYFSNWLSVFREDSFSGCSMLNNGTGFDLTGIQRIGKIGDFSPFRAYNVNHSYEQVGTSAFMNLDVIGSQAVSLTAAGIGEYAFTGSKLTAAYVALNSIPKGLFSNSGNLTICQVFGSSITTIGNSAFSNCAALNDVSFPNTITSVGADAFNNCVQLQAFQFSGISNIAAGAFANTNLENVTLTSTTGVNIVNGAFSGCPQLTGLYFSAKPEFSNGFPGWSNARYISVGVNCSDFNLGPNSWYSKSDIEKAYQAFIDYFFKDQPDTASRQVTFQFADHILEYDTPVANFECLKYADTAAKTQLTAVLTSDDYGIFAASGVIPDTTRTISQDAFNDVRNSLDKRLSKLKADSVEMFGAGTLSGLTALTSFSANGTAAVPEKLMYKDLALKEASVNSAQSIGDSAFNGCSLTTLTASRQLASIGVSAFTGCGFTKFPESIVGVTEIKQGAFSNCTALTAITLPDTVAILGESAFANCTSLVNATISKGVARLPAGIFDGNKKLQHITLRREVNTAATATQGSVFKDCATALSVVFLNQTAEQVRMTRNITDDVSYADASAFGMSDAKNASNATFYTSDNAYAHPMFIYMPDSKQVLVVHSQAFVVNGSGRLLSVDPVYEQPTITSAELDGISDIAANAFKDTQKTQRVDFQSFTWAQSKVVDNTFSEENAGSVNQLHFDTDNCPGIAVWNDFFEKKLGNNPNIRVIFKNGYAQGKDNIVLDNDPFIYIVNKSGKKVIVGVNDVKVDDSGVIYKVFDDYFAISADALSKTRKILRIQDFGDVSEISDYAFRAALTLSSITLQTTEDNPKIQPKAFADSLIREAHVNISGANGIAEVSGYGLEDTNFLRQLSYGEKVKAIAPSAMVNCRSSLTSVSFPAGMTSIGQAAFAEFTDQFPQICRMNLNQCASLNTIGAYAFYNSISTLDNATLSIGGNLTSIGAAAFSYDKKTWTQRLSGFTQIGAEEIVAGGASELRTIGPSAFMYNGLRSVSFPNQLEEICACAFAYPKHRFQIHIKNKIKRIGRDAFKCNVILNPNAVEKNIAMIDVKLDEIPDIIGTTIERDFIAENTLGFTDATILSASGVGANPYNSFAYIQNGVMNFCPTYLSIDVLHLALVNTDKTALTAYVPAYLSCISSQAFMDCTQLTSVSADESLSIGPSAFYGCVNLKQITHDVKSIYNIPSFHISGAVNDAAFYDCRQLTNVYLLSTVPYIGISAFAGCQNLTSMFEAETLAQKAQWSLSAISDNAFAGCSELTSFDIPRSISVIGDNVFKDCPKLKNVDLDLEAADFAKLVSADSVAEAVKVKFSSINDIIGTYGSTRINFLDISYMNDGVVKVDSEFALSIAYAKQTLSGAMDRIALTALEYMAFSASGQKYLNLSAISRIDQFVFNGLDELWSFSVLPNTDVQNPYELEEIGDYAFNGCKNLASINAGTLRCEKIGCYAFNGCESLLRMSMSFQALSSGSIGHGAFYGTSLNDLYIIDCPEIAEQTMAQTLETFKSVISYDKVYDLNPLELPEYCTLHFTDVSGKEIGKYDCTLHDLLFASVDLNRNALTFVDKSKESIKPLLLVKPVNGFLPAIAANTFHANIVGRWK